MDDEPGSDNASASEAQDAIDLVQRLYEWCLSAAPASMEEAALVFAITSVGGVAARAYNIDSSGLAQYWLVGGKSGSGKGIIKKCRARLFAEVAKHVPAVVDFKGMAYLASGQAAIRWMTRKPHPVCITDLDEFGHDLKEMSNPRNDNAKIKQQVYLQMWGVGGAGDVFDGMAYSDSEKNTGPIKSLNFTIVGTTTTKNLNEALTDKLASSGTLARFNVIEYRGDISPYNADHAHNFEAIPTDIVKGFENLTTEACRLARKGEVRNVEVKPEAEQYFIKYAEELRLRRNAMSDFSSDLLNRNLQKAKMTAATWAVGRSISKPVVTLKIAKWATDFIDRHANRLVAKFDNNEVGEEGGDETKQLNAVIREIGNYFTRAFDDEIDPKFGARFDMHRDHVITQTYLSRKLIKTAAFKGNNSSGGTAALIKALKTLTDADDLRQVPKHQMLDVYTTTAVAFAVTNSTRFLKDGK